MIKFSGEEWSERWAESEGEKKLEDKLDETVEKVKKLKGEKKKLMIKALIKYTDSMIGESDE